MRSLGKTNLRRERQYRENNSRRNHADAVREVKSPGQHRADSGGQKQQHSGLKIKFHARSAAMLHNGFRLLN